LTILFSIVSLAVLLGVGVLITRPRGPVLTDVDFGLAAISPNADGDADATRIAYRLRREARVSIYLEDAAGQRYYFREDEIRTRGPYEVLFSGIVDGFVLPSEQVAGEVTRRLLPDGIYTWGIEAVDTETDRVDLETGQLIIEGADVALPDLTEFSVAPTTFTPNQDGIDDRVTINVYAAKASDLTVYLVDETGNAIFIPQFQGARPPGEAGRHIFEYDGGIDSGKEPPPDGAYTVVVESVDDEGQRVVRSTDLVIENGGIPFAEIVGQPVGDTVEFSSQTVLVGDVLTFTLTVENYGDAPIRTTGPAPGHVYQQGEVFGATGFFEESGAWRVGIQCDTCETSYPWRWALGTPEGLTPIADAEGTIHYYLMPGERAVITGGIRLTEIQEARNPQRFWAGLIHEDVAITNVNNFVDPQFIEIVEPE
jgi:hypothetical protein